MESIDVISAHDVLHDVADILAVLRQTRVQQQLSVVVKGTLWVLHAHVVHGKCCGGLGFCTIGINPSMNLHTALVALVHHPLQRIPVRRRGLSLLTGEEATPRFKATFIEGVALRSHLEDDGINAVALQLIELSRERLLHLLGSHAQELSVNTLYPSSSEFPFVRFLSTHSQRATHQQQRKQKS